MDDVITIGAKAPVDSFVFVTIDGRIPKGMERQSTAALLVDLREDLQSFALNPSSVDIEPANFPRYAERVLWAALTAALTNRRDGQFVPLIRVFYGDTTPMITVGACLAEAQMAPLLARRMKQDFRYLLPQPNGVPYTIPPFNLTIRERYLLDAAVTAKKEPKRVRSDLKRIGMTREMVSDYRRMVRFVPKYFESYL